MAVAPPVMQAELNPAFLCWPSGANVKRKDPKRLFKAYVDVSENSGTPKSSILIGFSIINHPFWGTSIFGNTHMLYVVVSNTFLFSPPTSGNGSS